MRNNQPDELDRLLDEALASYSSAEPRPGLEQRVLHRVRGDGAPRRFGWWRWAVGIPVFASLLLLAVSHRGTPPRRDAERNAAQLPTAAAVEPAEIHPNPPARPRPNFHRPLVARSPLPRQDVFPLPAPLSPEERALMDLVTRFPEQARAVLIEAVERSNQPVEIPRIEIPPLPGGPDERF